ncbi:uncharacterized protein LOC110859712 [Folsomia candida]|uniref:Uncharacterized protein n=1 Tax=Folsomia candida TaxID=158441 RepID=A0A226DAX1_FOLCA|nr:uncharacterized protein LOC110859712 [Folsomia candida]OXA42048.1 hypothetical protein Fcan01_23064 [Folsomia candida]
MNTFRGELVILTIVCGAFSLAVAQLCIAPSPCDTNLASCTIGFGCLGSPITMCALLQGGNGTSDSACPAFPDGNHYCACQNCVGLINSLLYNCVCSTDYVCPGGKKLIRCAKVIPIFNIQYGTPQYSCCGNAVNNVQGC